MPDGDFKERMRAVKELLGLFRMERVVYLVATVAALGVLLLCAAKIWREGGDADELVAIVSSSGGLLYTTNRVLRMWSDALALVAQKPIGGDS